MDSILFYNYFIGGIMELPMSIKTLVAKQISKQRVVEIKASDINNQIFLQFVEDYLQRYSYMPTLWQSYYNRIKAMA